MLACLLQRPLQLLDCYVLRFRAIPLLDTDVSRLFTQSYGAMMGLARWHFVFHSRFRDVALKRHWAPVTTAEIMRYRFSIKAFQRIELRTQLLSWDDKRFYLEHVFSVGGKTAARCFVEGLIRSPQGTLKPHEVFAALGYAGEAPKLTAEQAAWISGLHNSRVTESAATVAPA